MADEPTNPDDASTLPEGDQETTKGERTFTQSEVNKLATREMQRGERKAREALAERLGMSIEQVEEMVQRQRESEDAKKDELEREREEKARIKADADRSLALARQEHHNDRVKLRLLRAGLPAETAENDEALDRVVALVKAEVGSGVEDIDSDISALKEQFPQLFQAADTTTTANGVPPSNPPGTPRKTIPATDALTKGKQRADQWMGKTTTA